MNPNYFCGYDIGALVMKSWVPKPPGHISCASNYDAPVFYYPVDNTSNQNIHGGSTDIIPNIIDATYELKKMGCKAVFTSCGYFGHYQKRISDESIMPAYLSSICLVPFILNLIGKKRKVAIICYNKERLTQSLFEACGVDSEMRERCYVYDIVGQPELGKIITDCGEYDISKAREEVVSVAVEAVNEHSDIGAFLLECTDLPPHSYAIQEATNMPVFDATIMIKFVQTLVCGGGVNYSRRLSAVYLFYEFVRLSIMLRSLILLRLFEKTT